MNIYTVVCKFDSCLTYGIVRRVPKAETDKAYIFNTKKGEIIVSKTDCYNSLEEAQKAYKEKANKMKVKLRKALVLLRNEPNVLDETKRRYPLASGLSAI